MGNTGCGAMVLLLATPETLKGSKEAALKFKQSLLALGYQLADVTEHIDAPVSQDVATWLTACKNKRPGRLLVFAALHGTVSG